MGTCKRDKHQFEEIYSYHPKIAIDRYIMWCKICGSIHIDDYSDGVFIRPSRAYVPTYKLTSLVGR